MRVMKSKTLFESFQENLKKYDNLKESSIYDKDFHDYSNVSNYELYDLADYYATQLRKSNKDRALASEIFNTLDKVDKYAERGEGFNESRYKKLCSLIDAAKETLNESDELKGYDVLTDNEIVKIVIDNFKTITGKDIKDVFNYSKDEESGGFFKQSVIDETAPSIGEYLKGKGLSQDRIDEIYYKLDDELSLLWKDYAPSDLNEAFDLDDALADVTAWAECIYKGSEINSSTIESLLNSKEELKDKYTDNQKAKIVKWFEDEEKKYMPADLNEDGSPMKKYLVKLKHDDGTVKIETTATSKEQAIKQVCDNEKAPDSAVVGVEECGLVCEQDETVRVVTTNRDERDYAITDITELNEVSDGDVQPPIDITGLLVEVDNKLTESYGDWGQINFQSTRFNVDTKDSNALFELRVGDKNYLMSMLLEENGSLLRVNNTDGKTIYKAKSKNVLSLAESYIKQFIPKKEEVPFCLIHMNEDLHSKLDFLKAYIDLYKKAPKEDKEMLKGIIRNDIYSFVSELSDEIKATEPNEDNKLELPTFDSMVEEVFGKEWVKEQPKENKLELDGVEQLKESMSFEDIVKDSYNHYTSEVGKVPTTSDIVNDIINNYTQDYIKDDTPDSSLDASGKVEGVLKKLDLTYTNDDEPRKGIYKESYDNQLYVYSNAQSYDKSDADSYADTYSKEAPKLKFKVRKDGEMYFVDFIGKKEDIVEYLKKLKWYNIKEIEDFIKPYNSLHEEVESEETAVDIESEETSEEPKTGLGTGYAQFYRRPKDINAIDSGSATAFTSGKASYIICSKEKLTKEDFDRLQNDFQAPNEYCKSFDPIDVENYSYNVIEFSCDAYDYKLLVDPSNHDNCRWVAKLGGSSNESE